MTQRFNAAVGNLLDISSKVFVLTVSALDCEVLWGERHLFFSVVRPVVLYKHHETHMHDRA